jgi:hypothetical protein
MPAGATRGRTATGAVSRFENGWVFGPWGFDSLSFRLEEAWPSWKGSALLARRRFARSQVRVLLPPSIVPAWSSWKDARLLIARAQVRALPPELHAPVVEAVMTPGPQPGSCGFESRRGFQLAVGEMATPPASGAGRRRFESCQPDLRGRGGAVLASLMSSRPWVRIPPALLGGVAQTSRALACQARGHRFESGRPRFMVAVV